MFVALHTRHENRMRHIVICGLAGSAYFSKFSHKWHGLQKKRY